MFLRLLYITVLLLLFTQDQTYVKKENSRVKFKQVMTRKLQGRKPTKMEHQDEGRSKTEVQ